ncbi:MAG: bifunctional DNA-formamidopyrimidine glycosylase/DNA-(apurinic or apyrimidinic site) lyase [Verrucomicrobiae bacterium]|nr:bifunctional DNA-formamidopyrimidine glycosylase/DNA-(apurinic or apyrimidinic site) lyase [Verrucomicrobiae bacterium]
MPELPEVEVLVRHLGPQLAGRRISEVRVFHAKVVRPHRPTEFARAVRGARFHQVRRRGKYLLFDLEQLGGGTLLMVGHLGMTGRMYLTSPSAPWPAHVGICFQLEDARLVYVDPRRFGRMTLEAAVLQHLGPEPLDRQFTARRLQEHLAGSRQAIKVRLMDQRVVAGVGNIYASEALWRAAISPRRAAGRLGREACGRLWRALRAVLREAIAWGSTIPLDFAGREKGEKLFYFGVREGKPGYYHERLRVYDRAGQPCLRCGAGIRRIIQGGRSTYYCPACQR